MADSPQEIKDKINRLIRDYMPWGQDGFPTKPGQKSEYRTIVEEWLAKQLKQYQAYATTLMAHTRNILDECKKENAPKRFLYRIDGDSLTKSPDGILEKMARKWKDTENPPIRFPNISELKDLGRFRIIANFLSDAELICKELQKPYGPTHAPLSKAQQDLGNEFQLEGSNFEDLMNLAPTQRGKGERCYKGCFQPKNLSSISIEVQIVTNLQESWDKKDHYLIYEPRRLGHKIPQQHEQEIFAMSELLYIADLTFDRLKQARESQTPESLQKGEENE